MPRSEKEEKFDMLYNTWFKNLDDEKKKLFVYDGIVNSKEYHSVNPKILFLLKDAYSDSGFDLRDFLSNGAKKKHNPTWTNASKWIEGIINLKKEKDYSWKKIYFNYNSNPLIHRKKWLNKISVINLKKYASETTRTNISNLYKAASNDKNLIVDEIELTSPDIIILCSDVVNDIYFNILYSDSSQEIKPISENNYAKAWKQSNRIIISTFHPSATRARGMGLKREKWYENIIDIIKKCLQ